MDVGTEEAWNQWGERIKDVDGCTNGSTKAYLSSGGIGSLFTALWSRPCIVEDFHSNFWRRCINPQSTRGRTTSKLSVAHVIINRTQHPRAHALVLTVSDAPIGTKPPAYHWLLIVNAVKHAKSSGESKTHARRIQCIGLTIRSDELRPKCSACTRHEVDCQYVLPPARTSQPQHQQQQQHRRSSIVSPDSTDVDFGTPLSFHGTDRSLDHMLELRLIHQWTAHTSTSFSTVGDFWRLQAPLVAVQHRCLLDAMLALSALHAARTPAQRWLAREGRMEQVIPIREPHHHPPAIDGNVAPLWKMDAATLDGYKKGLEAKTLGAGMDQLVQQEAQRTAEMLTVSHVYFDRAIEGHRQALLNLSISNIEAVYLTSIIVSFHALFELGGSEIDEGENVSSDPGLWVRLAYGTVFICDSWKSLVGDQWVASSGVLFGAPDFSNEAELHDPKHAKPFERVLKWAREYENMTHEDGEAYSKALSYIGLAYKNVMERSEPVMATSRRFMAMPALVPYRFIQLIEMQVPRAMVILAHMFATMKLIEDRLPWFRGIANRQIPEIDKQIPTGWKEMMIWPNSVLSGEIRIANHTGIKDIIT
nr:hypothetical protein CFP56_19318 [Quercus suber]